MKMSDFALGFCLLMPTAAVGASVAAANTVLPPLPAIIPSDAAGGPGKAPPGDKVPALAPAPAAMTPPNDDDVGDDAPFSEEISVAQMRHPQGIYLGGDLLQAGMRFTVPASQVVTYASLDLALKVSAALAARGSSLQLMLNGQPLGTLPLSASEAGPVHYRLVIPAKMVVAQNNLSFRINDAGRLVCKRDTGHRYWLTVLPTSTLMLSGQRLKFRSDLHFFPRPFFDPLRMIRAKVPMVFGSAPKPGEVSAAVILASWLGMQADYRGIHFPVSHARLPQGNGVIFGHPGETVAGIVLPQTGQPLIKIIDNPASTTGKLLLIVGNNDNQLRQAAWRLINAPLTTQGDTLQVPVQTVAVRQPYDAPRWINTRHPVLLYTLLPHGDNLVSSGISHDALWVNFRAAPDLFLWDGETFPLNIHYRFPSVSWLDEQRSFLSVALNGAFLGNLPVNKPGLLETLWHRLGGDARQEHSVLSLAPYRIYGDNQLQLWFNIQAKASAPCNVLSNNNIRSRILSSSSIDLSKSRHFGLLPNLSWFVGASFPFSRLADYSHTLLLLPQQPSDAQISTLLGLAARAASATGVALARNTVAFGVPQAGALRYRLRASNVLAVTTLADDAFNRRLLAHSPYVLRADGQRLGIPSPSLSDEVRSWLAGDWGRRQLDADRYLSSNERWRGFISYRSPWSKKHLVVVALATDDAQLLRLNQDLAQPELNAAIRGDTAIISGTDTVRSFRVGPQFPSGQMPWYMMTLWYASQHCVVLALITLALATLLGLASSAMLRRHARQRLQLQQHADNKEVKHD
ncbi:cellulose synthase regulator BcsB [Izhakiella australiensis]|uniref:Cyclic di-GMP-binding protein n=1 Tax=Izhakiella australiensis TaxID=1926881 RepID=A0A1S8Y757_9GAMM|nr:cellulose biosynthesis cyclic di-GMP-binding regulatory protein BcsB [Izhakiella australiensis]OON34692.1 cellulose synthase regulator BcsB [Izhakiella australiensis]